MSTIIDRRTIRTNREDFGYGASHSEYQQQKATIRSYHVIWFVVGLIDALLGFRFVFEALGANPFSGFAQFVYNVSYIFAVPFRTLFGITNVANYAYFDWSILVAIAVYLLIGFGLVQLLRIISPTAPGDARHRMVV
jgi:uncharacterized protein YggT (Ycf19 family)